MSQRLARQQRRAAMRSIRQYAAANGGKMRDDIIAKMHAAKLQRRYLRAFQGIAVVVLCGVVYVAYRLAVR